MQKKAVKDLSERVGGGEDMVKDLTSAMQPKAASTKVKAKPHVA
jgi:hypothetical protein